MHAFDVNAKYAIFDMARCNDCNYYPWNFMENLKNGWFTTTKYNGRQCILNNKIKVLVLMNQEPPKDKLSADRWNIFRI